MKLNKHYILKVPTNTMGEEPKTNQEGEKRNFNGAKQIFSPTTQSTHKSKEEELEDAMYNCG